MVLYVYHGSSAGSKKRMNWLIYYWCSCGKYRVGHKILSSFLLPGRIQTFVFKFAEVTWIFRLKHFTQFFANTGKFGTIMFLVLRCYPVEIKLWCTEKTTSELVKNVTITRSPQRIVWEIQNREVDFDNLVQL